MYIIGWCGIRYNPYLPLTRPLRTPYAHLRGGVKGLGVKGRVKELRVKGLGVKGRVKELRVKELRVKG